MMSFPDAVKICFQKYITFSGRAPRAEYWYFTLFSTLLGIATSILDSLIFGIDFSDNGAINGIVSLALFLPGLTVLWRRLHDINKPGWYCLLWVVALFAGAFSMAISIPLGVIIMLAAFGVLIYWLVKPSDLGENDYGPNPYDDPGKSLSEVFE